ncbi:MAG: hypothetical protein ACI4E1_01245 [Lachnospira sp.]
MIKSPCVVYVKNDCLNDSRILLEKALEVLGIREGLNSDQIAVIAYDREFFENEKLDKNADYLSKFYEKWDDKTFNNLVDKMKVNRNAPLRLLSEGERNRLQYAICMAIKPKILVLNNPIGQLDYVFREELYEHLHTYALENDAIVLISSNYEEEFMRIVDYEFVKVNGSYSFVEIGQ